MTPAAFRHLSFFVSFLMPFSEGTLSALEDDHPRSDLPNIVFIFSDEMNTNQLGCYGGKYETPNIDRLAAEGMRFTKAFTTAAACTPSRYSVLSGQYPGRCQEESFLQQFPANTIYRLGWNTYLNSSTLTIPQILKRAGYQTGMFGKNHVTSRVSQNESLKHLPAIPDGKPGERLVDEWLSQHQKAAVSHVCKELGFDEAGAIILGNPSHNVLPELQHHNIPWISAHSTDFIRRHAGLTPFFAFTTPTAIHGPWHPDDYEHDLRLTPGGFDPDVPAYQTPAAVVRKRIEGLSSGEKHHVAGFLSLDRHVGEVLDQLDQLGIADNTIVIFAADHGVEPGKSSAYVQGNHVPLIIRWPGRISPGSVSNALVSLVDILPTLSAVAQTQLPTTQVWDGLDLSPLFKNPDSTLRTAVYTEMGYARAVFDGRYQYLALRYPDEIMAELQSGQRAQAPNHLGNDDGQAAFAARAYRHYFDADQLYDLQFDPFQMSNLWNDSTHEEVRDRLQAVLLNTTASFRHPFPKAAHPFMGSDAYTLIVKAALESPLPDYEWVKRDHDAITWPPLR